MGLAGDALHLILVVKHGGSGAAGEAGLLVQVESRVARQAGGAGGDAGEATGSAGCTPTGTGPVAAIGALSGIAGGAKKIVASETADAGIGLQGHTGGAGSGTPGAFAVDGKVGRSAGQIACIDGGVKEVPLGTGSAGGDRWRACEAGICAFRALLGRSGEDGVGGAHGVTRLGAGIEVITRQAGCAGCWGHALLTGRYAPHAHEVLVSKVLQWAGS